MLGRFLEISVRTPVIQQSLEFYQALGFEQALVSETWPYPYAVVTDGRLFIGLHGTVEQGDARGLIGFSSHGFSQRLNSPDSQGQPESYNTSRAQRGAIDHSPTLTFVLPELGPGIERLEQHGVNFDELRLGSEVFNQATFTAADAQRVNLLEARTFSPPNFERTIDTACGYFSEYAIPVRDPAPGRTFWEPLGFVALEEESFPFPRTTLTSDLINLGMYRTRAWRQPLLVFEDTDVRERLTKLRERGFRLSDDMPDSLDESTNGILEAPEGTRLLLMQTER